VTNSLIDRLYSKMVNGEFTEVDPSVFDVRYSLSAVEFGFLRTLLPAVLKDCLGFLEGLITRDESGVVIGVDIPRWKESSRMIGKGIVFIARDLPAEIEIENDLFAWNYCLGISVGSCLNGHFLAEKEAVGVSTDDGLLLRSGPMDVFDFPAITGKMRRIRIAVDAVRNEEALWERPERTRRSLGTDFGSKAAEHHGSSLAYVRLQDPKLDFTSIQGYKP